MNTGVYVIEHTASGKKYVGSAAKSFSKRWGNHRNDLRKGTHRNAHLQAAWNKYGESAFLFRIVKTCLPEDAVSYEQAFIDLYKSADCKFGYNIAPIAGSTLGINHTAETRAKMSAARKFRPPHTAETRAKMSSAAKLRPPHTAETRAKMSSAAKLRPPYSAETRAKNVEAHRGRKLTAEHCAKIGSAGKGRKVSAETRAKISAAKIVWWAAKRTFLGVEQ